MNTKKNLWTKAEEDFHKWIEEPGLYPENELTSFRKSLHIFFRRKYHNQLTQILKKVFDEIPHEKLLQDEDKYPAHGLLSESEGIHYCREVPLKKLGNYEDENKRILDGFWQDDYKTIAAFYENEFSKVAHLVLSNSGTIDNAKDVFQDAMVILMDKYTWGKLELINCSLGTYIYAISKNIWYNHLRSRKKKKMLINAEESHAVDISVDYYDEEPENYENVNSVISNLGNPCKELLELYYFENHSWETIAMAMGYTSAASARNQKYKCLEKVRKQLASAHAK